MAKIAANTDEQTKEMFVNALNEYNKENIGRVSQDGLVNLLADACISNMGAVIQVLHEIKFLKK